MGSPSPELPPLPAPAIKIFCESKTKKTISECSNQRRFEDPSNAKTEQHTEKQPVCAPAAHSRCRGSQDSSKAVDSCLAFRVKVGCGRAPGRPTPQRDPRSTNEHRRGRVIDVTMAEMSRADSTRRATPTFQRPISRPASSRAFSGAARECLPKAVPRPPPSPAPGPERACARQRASVPVFVATWLRGSERRRAAFPCKTDTGPSGSETGWRSGGEASASGIRLRHRLDLFCKDQWQTHVLAQ